MDIFVARAIGLANFARNNSPTNDQVLSEFRNLVQISERLTADLSGLIALRDQIQDSTASSSLDPQFANIDPVLLHAQGSPARIQTTNATSTRARGTSIPGHAIASAPSKNLRPLAPRPTPGASENPFCVDAPSGSGIPSIFHQAPLPTNLLPSHSALALQNMQQEPARQISTPYNTPIRQNSHETATSLVAPPDNTARIPQSLKTRPPIPPPPKFLKPAETTGSYVPSYFKHLMEQEERLQGEVGSLRMGNTALKSSAKNLKKINAALTKQYEELLGEDDRLTQRVGAETPSVH
jgi:hypothetical protein